MAQNKLRGAKQTLSHFCERVLMVFDDGINRMKVREDTEIEPTRDGDEVCSVCPKPHDGQARGAWVVAQLRGRGDVTMSTDEIMALTRGE